MTVRIKIPQKKLKNFCQRWKIIELSLFGSAIREDFSGTSDIDILVSFAPDVQWSLFDLLQMQDELQIIFGREVDLVEREGLRNPFRRKAILNQREIIYAAR